MAMLVKTKDMTPQERETAARLAQCVRSFRAQDVYDIFQSGFSANVEDPETGKPVFFTLMDQVAAIDEDDVRGLGIPYALVLTFHARGSVDPNICDKDGVSALRHALALRTDSLVEILTDFGADVNEKYKDTGDTPLHDAVRLVLSGGGARSLERLLAAGGDATICNNAGWCAYDIIENASVPDIPFATMTLPDAKKMMEKTQPVKNLLESRTLRTHQEQEEKLRARMNERLRLKPKPKRM